MIKFFNEGYQSKDGICPYPVGSYAAFFWNNGYRTALKERKA